MVYKTEAAVKSDPLRTAYQYRESLQRMPQVQFPVHELDEREGDALLSVSQSPEGIKYSYRRNGKKITKTLPSAENIPDIAVSDSAVFVLKKGGQDPQVVLIGGRYSAAPDDNSSYTLHQYAFTSLPVEKEGIQPAMKLNVATVTAHSDGFQQVVSISESLGGVRIKQIRPVAVGHDPVWLPDLRMMDEAGVRLIDSIYPVNGTAPKLRTQLPFENISTLMPRQETFGSGNIPCLVLQKISR